MEKTNPRAAFSYHSKPISHSPGKKCQWMEKNTIKKIEHKSTSLLITLCVTFNAKYSTY